MKLFTDKNLKEPIQDTFTFGIVPVGETVEKTIWLKNEAVEPKKATGSLVEMEITVVALDPTNDTVITDERIVIKEAPEAMKEFEIKPIRLEWTPAVDLEQGLKAKLTIRAKKIVG